MEEIFEEFNKLVQEMAEAVAESKEPEETQVKYDSLIDKAEEKLEKDLESFFKKEQEQLEKEQSQSDIIQTEVEIEEEDSLIDKEIKFLKENAKNSNFIAKRFNKTNNKVNGFSTQEIYLYLGGTSKTQTEKKLSEFIFENLK